MAIRDAQEVIKKALIYDPSNTKAIKDSRALSAKWYESCERLLRKRLTQDKKEYMQDLAEGNISPYDGQDDILTLERAGHVSIHGS